MPVAWYRIAKSQKRQEALATVSNDKEALTTILVPVPVKRRAFIVGVTTDIDSWDYEFQTVARAKPPEEEIARAKLEGRYHPERCAPTFKDKRFEAPLHMRTPTAMRTFGADRITSADDEHEELGLTIRGDIQAARAANRKRYLAWVNRGIVYNAKGQQTIR